MPRRGGRWSRVASAQRLGQGTNKAIKVTATAASALEIGSPFVPPRRCRRRSPRLSRGRAPPCRGRSPVGRSLDGPAADPEHRLPVTWSSVPFCFTPAHCHPFPSSRGSLSEPTRPVGVSTASCPPGASGPTTRTRSTADCPPSTPPGGQCSPSVRVRHHSGPIGSGNHHEVMAIGGKVLGLVPHHLCE